MESVSRHTFGIIQPTFVVMTSFDPRVAFEKHSERQVLVSESRELLHVC
jgi:hypothetical protein